MFQSFVHSLIESNALWLIWAALGVLILAVCIVFSSVVLGDSEEPLYSGPSRRDDDSKMTV
ncbi:hypothetical protein AWB71_03581 [Caballeronia peredens]|nr:hypothetical protein AWB71_03581 [Caballeronia peredens]